MWLPSERRYLQPVEKGFDIVDNAPKPSHPATPVSVAPPDRPLLDRLAYLNLTEADAQRLRGLLDPFERSAEAMVEAFYAHLFRFPNSARFLADPALVERLKQLQREHFQSLFTAHWDEAYAQRRRQVGLTHADMGIDPEMFLGAYNQYVQHCFARFLAGQPGVPQPMIEALKSLLKVVFLDIGLALDSYFSQSTQTLRQVLDMYWKANIELRQFAQLASHDLKTPLATVANLCDEALDEFGAEMPADARQLIEQARQRTFRMGDMIDELLATTVTLGDGESLEEVATEGVLAEAIDRIRPTLDKKQIVLEISDTLPVVWGNRVRLRESFYNLLSNAAKFIERRPGRITVGVENRPPEWLFSVADNGPGVPPEECERIFAPFRRLPVHRDQPGSGLGLYFTKTMVEHQGGRIWVESTPGEGSTFFIALQKPGNVDLPPRSGRE